MTDQEDDEDEDGPAAAEAEASAAEAPATSDGDIPTAEDIEEVVGLGESGTNDRESWRLRREQ